ncbi:hypothetical protein B0T20DRAFT_452893 [Sordaria brevicollis]|uniref:Uncharacterized protein n=1 Tax=Sordaria brevicollis TaxID=83679 RepID=A0AAE0PGC8_SORBR|nr:hypothetical protein B0T20DRAFT_452893 [Sordaria brevicollis]
MCFYRTKQYKACGHTEFRRFVCSPAPIKTQANPSDGSSRGEVENPSRFACGEQPQYVNALELAFCSHCRKTRSRNKDKAQKDVMSEKQQSRESGTVQRSLPASESRVAQFQNPQILMVDLKELDAQQTQSNRKVKDVEAVSVEALGLPRECSSYKGGIKEMIKECRQICEEYQVAQTQISTMLETPSVSIARPTQPHDPKPAVTRPTPSTAKPCPLSHSVTKVRRDLFAAKGRVRSMIHAVNTKSELDPVISSINRKSIAGMVTTINHIRKPDHSANPQPPPTPQKELTRRPLSYPNTRNLSKSGKLQVLSKHRYHRLRPIPEESSSQALVVGSSVADTDVLRRAKAVKIRSISASHRPGMRPRVGLRREMRAPPVPRHSMPPVAVPCSKYVDLGRRRVSGYKWSFIV